eukprot:gb/GFBE01004275.1/.p1 GENE.gb/GFBE01004275.1/~~gb/GFBE01004275.1/.p1  ORF type:complete len:144 (+),score=21.09 gb/GFBE01004275.1/:1-432(+)
MEDELKRLEGHRVSLEGQLRSLDSLEAFGNDAAELAHGLKSRGSLRRPMQSIAGSIEVLTELLREDVCDCQRLQATQVVAAFEEIAEQLGCDAQRHRSSGTIAPASARSNQQGLPSRQDGGCLSLPDALDWLPAARAGVTAGK